MNVRSVRRRAFSGVETVCNKGKNEMKRCWRLLFVATAALIVASLSSPSAFSEEANPQYAYQEAVVADWIQQERDFSREISSVQSLQAVVDRGREFADWASDEDWVDKAGLDRLNETLDSNEQYLKDAAQSPVETIRRYLDLRSQIRSIALANPDVVGRPIVFLQEERFTWQMLHEYLSYYYQECGMHGGGIYVLKEPGRSFEVESLTEGKFPKGVFQTLSLSFDAKTIYFAFADFSKVQPDDMPKTDITALQARPYVEDFDSNYMKKSEGKFHLYKMNLADGSVEQLTDGPDDDFDPTETPDGDVIFMSTRRGGFGRCHGHYEPLRAHTLHRLNADKSVSCLSWHETNEWQPTFLHDGRVLYTRWDYVDRNAARHHGLWTTNPDGTNSAILFGNYTFETNACYQSKAIPNSNKVMFVAGAHHLDVGGTLVMLDPNKVRYDPETAEDDLSSIEWLTPEIPAPEVTRTGNQVCKQYYFSPWPLSEEIWLTSYSHDPIGGYLSNTTKCGKLGIYYRDRFGNLELLYKNDSNEESCLYPIPLAERERPRVIPSSLPPVDPNATDPPTGTFVLSNVYESLKPFPEGRKIKELRVVQLLPKAPDYRSNSPRIGFAGSANARAILGSVPVEKDGSAHFTVPANLPVYFQAIDEDGRAVQSMRSIVYLQPGENRGCVGCHEQTSTALSNENKQNIASLRGPSEMTPAPEDARPFSYPRFIQPILDKRCVSCHDGSENAKAGLNLTGGKEGIYTCSYNALGKYLRWYEWGGATYREISTMPGESGADISPLSNIINDQNHQDIDLTDEERRNLYLWMDAMVPFYGVYDASVQALQQDGQKVEMPELQ